MNSPEDTYTLLKEISFSLLASGKTIKARAEGFSMYPFIKPGTSVLLGPVDDETVLSPGEIIAWKRDSGFVLHRLVSIIRNEEGTFFITRGDSCLNEDSPIQRGQIAGRVINIEDTGGNTREGEKLIARPFYFYNRLRVWSLFKIKRILSIFKKPFISDEK